MSEGHVRYEERESLAVITLDAEEAKEVHFSADGSTLYATDGENVTQLWKSMSPSTRDSALTEDRK